MIFSVEIEKVRRTIYLFDSIEANSIQEAKQIAWNRHARDENDGEDVLSPESGILSVHQVD
jgi:hypothetical protein